jgi:serine/threonine protein kinase/dienelactone hydrolase
MIGKTISHYKILEKLGEGGMGVVYKARDSKLDRIVALKFLPKHLLCDNEAKTRFEQEAKAASALNHTNITTIYEINEAEDECFISMEYIEGKSLKQLIKEKEIENWNIGKIIDIGIQIAEGLSKAHQKGIIHRDIKSDNIMLTADGLVKIMDFGLAKLRGASKVTKTGSTLGTLQYMSPEQVQGLEVDQRSDIFSFGVVLYEMITGQLPFKGEHEAAIMYSIINENPKQLQSLRSGVPDYLEKIVTRCLNKDVALRCKSMREVLADLVNGRSGNLSPVKLTPKFLLLTLRRPKILVPFALIFVLVGYFVFRVVQKGKEIAYAREQLLPEIDRLANESEWHAAFILAKKAEQLIPNDSMFLRLLPRFSRIVSIKSDPLGVNVYRRDYSIDTTHWEFLGITPIDSIWHPFGLYRLKFEKQGFLTLEQAAFSSSISSTLFKLDPVGSIPDDMIRVPGGFYTLDVPGLDHLDSIHVNEYLLDKYEVTNKKFKEFVDSGGYQKREYWKRPFVKNGRTISWDEAINQFRDATGRPGPASWELGTYSEGKDDYPVNGISWYEASAYAEFAGKSLPSIYHWNIAAVTPTAYAIVPLSNINNNKGLASVGVYKGMCVTGAYDMAGNVREWCWNPTGNQRYILGGGWNDLPYMFNDAYAQDPWNRSLTNGFRCMKYLGEEKNRMILEREIVRPFRDFLKERPVPNHVFRFYLSLFKYDKTLLNVQIESIDTTEDRIKQRISFDAAYGHERMIAYIFLPRKGTPPYQTVVYFPGSGAIHARSSADLEIGAIDFLVKNGRAVMYPIYKSTYERGDNLHSDYANETNFYKEHVIMWAKDIARSIDYLETRRDIDTTRLAYYGLSWGGEMGPIMVAVERRFKVVVLYVAGLAFQKAQPEADAINYVSRVKQPILLLNGKYDHFFPYETSQLPLFKLLGTSTEHKRQFVDETGHFVARNQLIKEILDWLDHYLGPVR